jgi:hypothetical protein
MGGPTTRTFSEQLLRWGPSAALGTVWWGRTICRTVPAYTRHRARCGRRRGGGAAAHDFGGLPAGAAAGLGARALAVLRPPAPRVALNIEVILTYPCIFH